MNKGRKKFSLGLDFSGGRVDRRKNVSLNRGKRGQRGGWRERRVKGALA